MNNIKKNNFLFIILISALTLILLIVGAMMLYKDNSKTFQNDGYIIETTTKTNNKYYFNGNTKYKASVDNKINFQDTKSKEVSVDPASFVHYSNGNITFLKRGALVNLTDLNSPMVPYYNITADNTIVKEQDNYTVSSNDKKISIESFIGRISDNKYIIAGKDLELKIPTKEERIKGDYFEILYVEEGIVKIDNEKNSFQVTAQDSYVYAGDNITISLGDGKIFYDGDVKMLLSQITINGNENIDLDIDDKDGTGVDGTGGGGADGKENAGGNGEGEGGGGDGLGEDGLGLEGLENKGNGNGNGEGGDKTTASPQIELIEASVTSTTIDASLQLNNASLAKGAIEAHLTNVQTGEKVYSRNIDLINGTFAVSKDALMPATEYALTIIETGTTEKQYFQKIFRTKELGLSLEKVYATDTSLSYKINFDENTDVTKAKISIYDNNGSNKTISPNEFTIYSNAPDTSVIFTGLKSNTSYSVSIDTVWMNNAAYSNLYSINRIDSTLKETPTITGVNVETNAEEVKFTISLDKVTDKDESIVSYTYNFYRADDITLDNDNPEVVYSITKNDKDALVVDLNQIKELKAGTDYRCKIVAQYDDNEMIREVSTDYSRNFLIKSKPSVNWEVLDVSINSISGKLTLVDTSCTVPISGRTCNSKQNEFKLAYYKLKDGEETSIEKNITINPNNLTKTFELPMDGEDKLNHNTTYAIKLFGDYYDDNDTLHKNVQIGETLYVTTDKSPDLHLNVIKDNKSGYNSSGERDINNVVTFDANLVAPQDNETIYEDIATITLNLYSGRYNKKEKFIGSYTITDPAKIEDFFTKKLTINNELFKTSTGMQLDTLENLIKVSKYCPDESEGNEDNCVQTLNKWYTVEVEDVYTEIERINKLEVTDNLYTFALTPTYYLDARIASDTKTPKYIDITPIKKEDLTEEEYTELKRKVTNLDELNDDTVVGVILTNSLSDLFVSSAFTYEKVVVGYNIKNLKTNQTISYMNSDETINPRYSLDQGNKYRPSELIVYLDPSEMDDGKNFTRGYEYEFSYELHFTTEDGENPNYTNGKLTKKLTIDRQAPIYTQYISTSSDEGITYRYTFSDVDNAIAEKKLYYTVGESNNYIAAQDALKADKSAHNVTLTFEDDNNYKFYYKRKGTTNVHDTEYISIDEYKFEKEKTYNNEKSFELINNYNNNLTIKLENNDYNNRAAAYKVVLKADGVTDYVRYFLASRLDTVQEETTELDEEGNPIVKTNKIIGIDYAAISKFMNHPMTVTVYSYYDSGLVGLDQNFNHGMILKDIKTNKYLNIYNEYKQQGNTNNYKWEASPSEDTSIAGINYLKREHHVGDESIGLYNLLLDTRGNKYEPTRGATFNEDTSLGIDFTVTPTNAGAVLTYNNKDYQGYNARVLNEANLKTDDNNYQFNEIVPTINVTTNNTINSIRVNITPSGIYGNNQFRKNNEEHNKIYVDFYSDEDLTNKLTSTPLTTNIHISGNDESGYAATIDSLEYNNLIPATKYYFTVYAYINNKYTRLFDSSSKGKYITKTYNGSTLNDEGILSRFYFEVTPDAYSGEVSRKTLNWQIDLKNTENYKLRFELYRKYNETYSKAVNFDGTDGVSCNKNVTGNSSTGYVSGCYISVPKENIDSIKSYSRNTYVFSGNDFVFGDNYYKLTIYAIPYTNNEFDEEHKLAIYSNVLKNTPEGSTAQVQGKSYRENIILRPQEEPKLSLNNTLDSGYDCPGTWNENGQCANPSQGYYYVSFIPTATDPHYTIKYGKYKVILKDIDGNILNTTCRYYLNDNKNDVQTSNNCIVEMNADSPNEKITFINLEAGTVYGVDLEADVFINNETLTTAEKNKITYMKDDQGVRKSEIIQTPPAEAFIALTSTSATRISNSIINITHNGTNNLTTNIIQVNYTISASSGEKVNGEYKITKKGDTIFTIGTDKIRKLEINLEESDNPTFMLKPGNTYAIRTQYLYCREFDADGTCSPSNTKLLYDVTNLENTTFTTILNL